MHKPYYLGANPPKTQDELDQRIRDIFFTGNSLSKVFFDVETVSIKERFPLWIGLAVSPQDAYIFPLTPEPHPLFPAHIFQNPAIEKAAWNILFDVGSLRDEALRLYVNMQNTQDVMIMADLAGEHELDLANNSWKYGVQTEGIENILARHHAADCLQLADEVIVKHCGEDVLAGFGAWEYYKGKYSLEHYDVEIKTTRILEKVSRRGMKLDKIVQAAKAQEVHEQVEKYRSICENERFNPASFAQVSKYLLNRGNWLPFNINKKTRKITGYSTAEDDLKKLSDPMATVILAYREAAKLESTYILPLMDKESMHCFYHMDTKTRRLGSYDRNMQNIPPAIRGMLIPRNTVFTDADLVQIELVCLAYMSNDPVMKQIYSDNGKGAYSGDLHQETADFIGVSRRTAKPVNFGMVYGATVETVMEAADIRDKNLATEWLLGWKAKYPVAAAWIEQTQQEAIANGCITTLFGRKIYLPSYESKEKLKRKGINYPIQGSAAEIIKRVMIIGDEVVDEIAPLELQVHDQLTYDGEVQLPVKQMTHVAPFETKMKIRRLERWE